MITKREFNQLDEKYQRAYYKLINLKGEHPYLIQCRLIDSKEKLFDVVALIQELSKEHYEVTKNIFGEAAFDAALACEESLIV